MKFEDPKDTPKMFLEFSSICYVNSMYVKVENRPHFKFLMFPNGKFSYSTYLKYLDVAQCSCIASVFKFSTKKGVAMLEIF